MLKEPATVEECVYYTNRTLQPAGHVRAWVYKMDCLACGKAKMGKPIEKGKVLIRAKEFVCPECKHTESKEEHEPKLTVEIKYTCPFCRVSAEATTQYKRKTFEGAPSYVFECVKCGKKIGISKKMK